MPAAVIAGAVISAAAATASAVQQKQAADYNAKMASQQAHATETQANENIRRQRSQNERILAAQRAAGALSGATMQGSALTALGVNAGILERRVGDTATAGLAQQQAFQNQAALYNSQGNAALTSGLMSAAGSLMSGVGQGYSQYMSSSTDPAKRSWWGS